MSFKLASRDILKITACSDCAHDGLLNPVLGENIASLEKTEGQGFRSVNRSMARECFQASSESIFMLEIANSFGRVWNASDD